MATRRAFNSREYRTFLSLLRSAREQSGVTQVELGRRLRVGQAFVSKSEGRDRRIDIIELRQICRALKVDFVDFVQQLDAELERHSR
jgi:transcriptional regulator with XRE-family HTH domain